MVIGGRTTTLPSWLLSWSSCCFRVGVKVYIISTYPHLWRCLLLVPTLLLWSDIPSTWWSIDIPSLFFSVLQLFRLCTPLVLLGVQVEVSHSFLHVFRFQYKASTMLHETHCGLSIPMAVWVDMLWVPWLLQSWMVLLISVPSSCGMTSSYFSCLAIPFVLVWMGWMYCSSSWQSVF